MAYSRGNHCHCEETNCAKHQSEHLRQRKRQMRITEQGKKWQEIEEAMAIIDT